MDSDSPAAQMSEQEKADCELKLWLSGVEERLLRCAAQLSDAAYALQIAIEKLR